MRFLLTAVPAHREPPAEDEVPRHVEDQHEQEPPGLVGEVEARLVLDVDPHQVQADDEDQQHDPRNALGDHEHDHDGHPIAGVSA
jgi:hypothetical protein